MTWSSVLIESWENRGTMPVFQRVAERNSRRPEDSGLLAHHFRPLTCVASDMRNSLQNLYIGAPILRASRGRDGVVLNETHLQ